MNFVEKAIFEKARKTAKNEEKRRKLAVFQMRSISDTRYVFYGRFRYEIDRLNH